MASEEPNITLYTAQTPNGIKISIALEELSIPYKVRKVDLAAASEQKTDWFQAINPNGRIPALTDSRPPFASPSKAKGTTAPDSINLFESGSIFLYLTTHYDPEFKISFPVGSREWHEMVNWVFWQNAGLGPMQGQSNHFTRYAPLPMEQHEYGRNRYQNETRRLYRVLETHFDKNPGYEYIMGSKCTVADITSWGWISLSAWAGVDIGEFPKLKEWVARCGERPGFKKGADVPEPSKARDILGDPKKMEEFAAKGREWVQKGMKEDAQK
ncbi:MAG: hypothetical protein M1820_009397 [Bogoriella megaspora]|nr:MAG: hypothetical protein M1820_009397 [Bogoriella megaspora]